jgi:16S rRNA (uracil1498-N3)-methyltransferase
MRRFYATPDSFDGTTVRLDENESRHLHSVLRLKAGDEISLFDGEGNEYRSRVGSAAKKDSILEILDKVVPAAPESPLRIMLAAALMKGDKTDLCIQKAVELGVAEFIPLITARTEKLPRNIEKQMSRWRRIALDATKQCGRAWLMKVREPLTLSDLIDSTAGEYLFFSERSGGKLPKAISSSVTVAVGPEGGWEDSEIALISTNQKVRLITLGGRTLRAETAAIAATAIVQHRYGDLN